jgi:hypothetical protein
VPRGLSGERDRRVTGLGSDRREAHDLVAERDGRARAIEVDAEEAAVVAPACAVRSGVGRSRPWTPASVQRENFAAAQFVSRPLKSPVT